MPVVNWGECQWKGKERGVAMWSVVVATGDVPWRVWWWALRSTERRWKYDDYYECGCMRQA